MVEGPTAWRLYQEDAAALFRRMGFAVDVEETLAGARAEHQVDVVVRLAIGGVGALWIVECKHWKSPVRKEQVMTLAHIAQDLGADRAFLLSESGFQAGALTAVQNTNVTLTSLAELSAAAKNDIATSVLRRILSDKVRLERQLYAHSFDEHGRSPDVVAVDVDEFTTVLGACFDMGMAATRALPAQDAHANSKLAITVTGFFCV